MPSLQAAGSQTLQKNSGTQMRKQGCRVPLYLPVLQNQYTEYRRLRVIALYDDTVTPMTSPGFPLCKDAPCVRDMTCEIPQTRAACLKYFYAVLRCRA